VPRSRRSSCAAATGRRDIQLALRMKKDFHTIADAVEADDVRRETDTGVPGAMRVEPPMKL